MKGDATVACIAAASIVAKVTRDELMVEYDAEYPATISRNQRATRPPSTYKPSGTGLEPIHRVSFCGNFLETARLF